MYFIKFGNFEIKIKLNFIMIQDVLKQLGIEATNKCFI